MQKKEARNIILDCANEYKTNLANKNLQFVFMAKDGTHKFEATFFERNYLHLTGVVVKPSKFTSSSEFYRDCIDRRLNENDFAFAGNGTTEMKLSILMQFMNIQNTAKMIGEYSFTKSLLYTEKIAGNVFGCMGFVRENDFYIPNTILKDDIRNITTKPQSRIVAILRKPTKEKEYVEVTYLAKGVSLDDPKLSAILNKYNNHEKEKIEEKPIRRSLDKQLFQIKERSNSTLVQNIDKQRGPTR